MKSKGYPHISSKQLMYCTSDETVNRYLLGLLRPLNNANNNNSSSSTPFWRIKMKPQWFSQELKSYSKRRKVSSFPLSKKFTVHKSNSDLFSNSIYARWSLFFWYVIPLTKFHHSHLTMQHISRSTKPLLFLSVTWKLRCIWGPAPHQCSSRPVSGNPLCHAAASTACGFHSLFCFFLSGGKNKNSKIFNIS